MPHRRSCSTSSCPEEELLPLARAIGRVFARLGEKKNRNKARLKFVVAEARHRRVPPARDRRAADDAGGSERGETFFDEIPQFDEKPGEKLTQLTVNGKRPRRLRRWEATNVYQQRQAGYAVVTVTCPLGDLTSEQMRALADIARRYAGGNVRTTVEQNIVLRWVPQAKLTDLYRELKAIGLSRRDGRARSSMSPPARAPTPASWASPPRAAWPASCATQLARKAQRLDEAIKDLRIKVSGCFNSCGQHHVADIGFYGNSRNVGGYTVPHFQVMLGGKWTENARLLCAGDGRGAVEERPGAGRCADRSLRARAPGRGNVPGVVPAHRQEGTEGDRRSVHGRAAARGGSVVLQRLGRPAAVHHRRHGRGRMRRRSRLARAVRLHRRRDRSVRSQLLLDDGKYQEADDRAYDAMLKAAHTLVQLEWLDAPTDPKTVVTEFLKRFVDTKIFWHRHHANQFSNYLVNRYENGPDKRFTRDTAAKTVEEANLFIDAAHRRTRNGSRP